MHRKDLVFMTYYKSKKGNRVLCLEHELDSSKAKFFDKISKSTYETELAKKEKRKVIENLKKTLARTDWVIVKIAEETDSEVIEELREKYADVITERKNARQYINELEAEL